tara:strand:- start:7416 stop:7994 length:579 start_codon:yes stop_codon:yes gene_type:complete
MILFTKNLFTGHNPKIHSWDEPTDRVFEGQVVRGRRTKGYGTSTFKYAGKTYEPEPWTTQLLHEKSVAEAYVAKTLGREMKFTFCLCGLYETGEDSIPHHSDTVPTLDDIVMVISFGAPRLINFREYQYNVKKETNTSDIKTPSRWVKEYNYIMEDGDALLLDGHSQMNTTHSVPPIENAGRRISLTFRTGL